MLINQWENILRVDAFNNLKKLYRYIIVNKYLKAIKSYVVKIWINCKNTWIAGCT